MDHLRCVVAGQIRMGLVSRSEVVRSAQAVAGRLDANRWLARVPIEARLAELRRLSETMPEDLGTLLSYLLEQAAAVHIGGAGSGDGVLSKVYVEQPGGFIDVPGMNVPFSVTHVGFKWVDGMVQTGAVPSGMVSLYTPIEQSCVTEQLDRSLDRWTSTSPARSLLDAMGGATAVSDVLAVTDLGSPRRSVDIGFLEPTIRIEGVEEALIEAFEAVGVGSRATTEWVTANSGQTVGRIAFGWDRYDRPFVTVYHAAVGVRSTSEAGVAERGYNGDVIVDGDRYPEYLLPGHSGELISSADVQGWRLIYWYPRADTPGCTAQAMGLRDQYEAFVELGCHVLGVSFDPPEMNRVFHDRYLLPFDLMSDSERLLAPHVGAGSSDSPAARRIAHLLDPNGIVAVSYDVDDPEYFAERVLDDLERLHGSDV